MKNLSIKWHSRAGQGAITASNALAEIVGKLTDYKIQSFPDFGAEKRGAPVVVFNRFYEGEINNTSHVKTPDIILLMDTTIVSSGEKSYEDILDNIEDTGTLIINTTQERSKFNELFKGKIYHVDASGISNKEIGKHIPNVPMLGALIKASGIVKSDEFAEELNKWLSRSLPENIVKANIKAFDKGLKETKLI